MGYVMRNASLLKIVALLAAALISPAAGADTGQSTRITDEKQHVKVGPTSYPFRDKADYVLKELAIEPGDVVVDIGAGDGWWTERIAPKVGSEGIVHAAEVAQGKVDQMKKKYADTPQIRPYLCKKDGTGLEDDSCDLAFFSQVYHHLNKDGRVAYLEHLRKVVRPTGRLVIIEKYPIIATEHNSHGTQLSTLISQAEQAGWVPLRCELITGAYHYIAIFAQKDLFPPEPPRKKK